MGLLLPHLPPLLCRRRGPVVLTFPPFLSNYPCLLGPDRECFFFCRANWVNRIVCLHPSLVLVTSHFRGYLSGLYCPTGETLVGEIKSGRPPDGRTHPPSPTPGKAS